MAHTTAAHALAYDISRVIAAHDLPADATLIVVAQILGYIVSTQNREEYTPEGVMAMVSEHFSIGERGVSMYGLVQ